MTIVRKRPSVEDLAGRRERRRERTRRALLDVALAHFARRGIYGTRVEDITEEADLGKGAFYNYFASKNDLVAALLSEAVEILDRDYLGRIPSPAGDPAELVAALAEAHDRFFDAHPHYPVLFHQARGLLMLDPSPDAPLRGVMQDYLGRIADKLAPPGDPASPERSRAERLDQAAAFAGAITGYRSHVAAGALPFAAKTSVEMLTGGLAARIESRSGARPPG